MVTLGEFQRWEQSGLFEHATAIETTEYAPLGQGRAERLYGARVKPHFFRVYGAGHLRWDSSRFGRNLPALGHAVLGAGPIQHG